MRHILKTSIVILGLSLHAQAHADECDDLSAQFVQHVKAEQFTEALTTFEQYEQEYCMNNHNESVALKRQLYRNWGDVLFADIFQGQPMRFDEAQTQRLLAKRKEINAALDAGNMLINNAWQHYFLAEMLAFKDHVDNPDANKSQFTSTHANTTNAIIEGYLHDLHHDQVSNITQKTEFESFIKEMAELQLLRVDPKAIKPLYRGGGKSALSQLTRMQVYRGANLASSQRQPVTAVTPIRFEFDSTQLNAQGEQEYRENLSILRANSTKKILLIGHTDAKGDEDYNCWLSRCRVHALRQQLINDGIDPSLTPIKVAWAGENIDLQFSRIPDFMVGVNNKDISILSSGNTASQVASDSSTINNQADPGRRRVEYELNGEFLLDRYHGQFCELTPVYQTKPCDFE